MKEIINYYVYGTYCIMFLRGNAIVFRVNTETQYVFSSCLLLRSIDNRDRSYDLIKL